MKLRIGAEELLTAANAHIGTFRLCVFIFAAEGWLRPFLARNVILLVRQLLSPFSVILSNLLAHAARLHLSR
jgi:hypothetical protein